MKDRDAAARQRLYGDPKGTWASAVARYQESQQAAMTTPDWREVYGDDYAERVWDGRGLSTDDQATAGGTQTLYERKPEREAGS